MMLEGTLLQQCSFLDGQLNDDRRYRTDLDLASGHAYLASNVTQRHGLLSA
jgi:hypothetical protein